MESNYSVAAADMRLSDADEQGDREHLSPPTQSLFPSDAGSFSDFHSSAYLEEVDVDDVTEANSSSKTIGPVLLDDLVDKSETKLVDWPP